MGQKVWQQAGIHTAVLLLRCELLQDVLGLQGCVYAER